jgi:hypothetical protein
MRNFLAIVGAARIAFLALGWYLGWYQVSSQQSSQGKQSLQVDINPGKITEDVKKGVEKGNEIVDHLRDKPKSEPSGPASNFFSRPRPPRTKSPLPPIRVRTTTADLSVYATRETNCPDLFDSH